MEGEVLGGGYPPPVGELLTRGDPRGMPARPVTPENPDGWPDYLQEFGLGPVDIPDLIRLTTDDVLNRADTDNVEAWAPVHAWRALVLQRRITRQEVRIGGHAACGGAA